MDEKYYIGIPEIDAQHEEISDLVALLRVELARPEQRRLVHQTLKRLNQLLTTHFEFEEALMQLVNYVGLAQHKKMHKGVLKLFNDYFDRPPEPADFDHFVKLLGDKVFSHVMEHDMLMTTVIKEHLAPPRKSAKPEPPSAA